MIPNLNKQLKITEMQSHVLPLLFRLLYIHVEPTHFQTMVFPNIEQFFQIHDNRTEFQIVAKHIGIITKYCSTQQRQKSVAKLYHKCLKIRFHIQLQKVVLNELVTTIQNDLFEKKTLCNIILPVLAGIIREKAYNDKIQILTSLR